MKHKITIIFTAILFAMMLITAGLVLLNNNRTQNAADHKIHIVAAENFWGNIAAQIGGDHVQVTSIITDPTADPHLYESNAKNAADIAQADIVITNGLGYDDFMDKLLEASQNKNRTVLKVSDFLKVSDEQANPHLWYDIPRIALVAGEIEARLNAKDAANAPDYHAHLQAFTASLQTLLKNLETINNTYPGVPVAYTERVPGYVLEGAGLTVKTPPAFASALEEGNEPSPADQTAMETLMAKKQIRVLLYNSQASSPVTQHIREIAAQNNIPIVPVTETLPADKPTYQAWMQSQLDALLKALENTK